MMPVSDHTGTPRHFHSSTTSGAAALISARIFASVLPRQSPSDSMRASISFDAAAPDFGPLARLVVFFIIVVVLLNDCVGRLIRRAPALARDCRGTCSSPTARLDTPAADP